ncbi:hypothetical protein [Celeribacter sp.]
MHSKISRRAAGQHFLPECAAASRRLFVGFLSDPAHGAFDAC